MSCDLLLKSVVTEEGTAEPIVDAREDDQSEIVCPIELPMSVARSEVEDDATRTTAASLQELVVSRERDEADWISTVGEEDCEK